MNIYIIPKVIETYKKQYEYSVEYKLIDFLNYVFKNCKIEVLINKKINIREGLIVISGGNTIKKFSKKKCDIVRDKIDSFYFNQFLKNKKKIKILAICHGAQFVSNKFNSNLFYSRKKNHIKPHEIIFGNRRLKVNSFHNIIIKKVKNNLKVLAIAKDKTIEAFIHKEMNILGMIWHPERNKKFKEFDKNLIKKYL